MRELLRTWEYERHAHALRSINDGTAEMVYLGCFVLSLAALVWALAEYGRCRWG